MRAARKAWSDYQARRGRRAAWEFMGYLEAVNWDPADRDRVTGLYTRGQLSATLERGFRKWWRAHHWDRNKK